MNKPGVCTLVLLALGVAGSAQAQKKPELELTEAWLVANGY